MDSAGPDGGGRGRGSSPYSQWSRRSSRCFPQDQKASQVCRYFQRGFCFHGEGCSYQHLPSPRHLQWGRRRSEPHVTLPGPRLGLTRRGSEPSYLPSVAVSWGCIGANPDMELGPEGLFGKVEDAGGSSRETLSLPSADGDHHYFLKPPPQSDPVREFLAPFQSFDLEVRQVVEEDGGRTPCWTSGMPRPAGGGPCGPGAVFGRVQDSQDVMCGICMDKVWDKPEEAERLFGILPNCSHAHCLGCLHAWRKSRGDFPPGVIKACPQCRVHSSYIIPCRFWVSQGPEKEQLIRNFKARTSQIQCRFFMRGNGRCPFKSDCIYLHQLPDEASSFDPLWPESMQLASVVGTPVFLGGTEPDEEVFFMDCALGMAFWGSELLLDPNSSYNCLL
ncbi:probable E3 ubiquitin-protein ligase makorin-1 isoform X3 [Bubalus kerabau]|uniref:probable E3 ubiquitin-protein ligase makorin-1 isoform X3 n=1 Tax=Bubalus carabanensis TaxID=3119969 RepID=UPI00244E9844|nr:probable E3 ubiquitin-protein ligase makorin-1 isoform X3 [Bubalus carabanensis]